ncbi:MAG TPA: hypothetical protein VHB98_08575 [Chloroflexota bacterium]|nr:hypothetical protein [Chloroflexota bacterium]
MIVDHHTARARPIEQVVAILADQPFAASRYVAQPPSSRHQATRGRTSAALPGWHRVQLRFGAPHLVLF